MVQTASPGLSLIRLEHLKKRGDAALKEGDLRDAWSSYTEALAAAPESHAARARILANRALAYTKAGRFGDALRDADAAVSAAPAWDKGHWRRGGALAGLKRAPDAVAAYHRAWQLSKGDAACQKAVWAQVLRLTREQLAEGIIALLHQLQQEGAISAAEEEEVLPGELREAWFTILPAAHKGVPRPGPFYGRYNSWLLHGLLPAEAYSQRAAAHSAAKAFLQGRADAAAALQLLRAPQHSASGADEAANQKSVSLAELRLGQALAAEPEHADRDAYGAAKAFMRGLEADPDSGELREALEDVSRTLTLEQISQAREELLRGGCVSSAAAGRTSEGGSAAAYRLEVTLVFPEAAPSAFTHEARQLLRRGLAEVAGLPTAAVMLERAQGGGGGGGGGSGGGDGCEGLLVELHVRLRADMAAGERLTASLQVDLAGATGGGAVAALLGGPPDAAALRMRLVDLAAAAGAGRKQEADARQAADADAAAAAQTDRQLVQRPRPKLELALPYATYRLTRADGAPLERTDKHPFCLSRVYYDAAERPEEVWAETSDGACRWRQTGSEVKIIALKVPSDLLSRDLCVTMEPYTLKVENRQTGEVYLAGELERGIVPAQSVWTVGGGVGEDGCLLLLQKMNLELLRRHWMHSEMWWPRLFAGGPAIEWDDYEKDYSDLPQPVLAVHQAAEALRDVDRQLEAGEKSRRERLQEADDLRKRTRQERLRQLRAAAARPWASLLSSTS